MHTWRWASANFRTAIANETIASGALAAVAPQYDDFPGIDQSLCRSPPDLSGPGGDSGFADSPTTSHSTWGLASLLRLH